MRSPLERVEESDVGNAVSAAWGLRIDELRYFPQGGGAYHWVALDTGGRRWFVTCDDLETKPWLGRDHNTVYDGLCAAYRTAIDLRAAGLAFVVAPLAAHSGAAAERLDDRHSVSVFERVDGEPGRWGSPVTAGALDEVITMLARLHSSTAAVCAVGRRGLDVPGRGDLADALADLGRPWNGGPLSEPARDALATNAALVAEWLRDLDGLAVEVAGSDPVVVTHGEPHPGNLMMTANGLVLVDWDTVALARPERDLWMLVDVDDEIEARYRELTGITLDRRALTAYRLLWALADVAAFTSQLRAEHRPDADADKALVALRSIFTGDEPAPYGSPRTRSTTRSSRRSTS